MLGVLLVFPYLNFIAAVTGEPVESRAEIPPPLRFACPDEPHIPEREINLGDESPFVERIAFSIRGGDVYILGDFTLKGPL